MQIEEQKDERKVFGVAQSLEKTLNNYAWQFQVNGVKTFRQMGSSKMNVNIVCGLGCRP